MENPDLNTGYHRWPQHPERNFCKLRSGVIPEHHWNTLLKMYPICIMYVSWVECIVVYEINFKMMYTIMQFIYTQKFYKVKYQYVPQYINKYIDTLSLLNIFSH